MIKVHKLFELQSLGHKAGYTQFPEIIYLKPGPTRTGLLGYSDGDGGGIVIHATTVESMVLSYNPNDKNLRMYLENRGYSLSVEEWGRGHVVRVQLPNGNRLKGRWKTLTEAAIVALKKMIKDKANAD